MDQELIITVGQDTVKTILMLAAPMLICGLVVGLSISILQAVTQINEITITFVPKIVAILVALIIASPWMIQVLTSYCIELFQGIPGFIN
jgi:flagellar biosynthetic protein FliQ